MNSAVSIWNFGLFKFLLKILLKHYQTFYGGTNIELLNTSDNCFMNKQNFLNLSALFKSNTAMVNNENLFWVLFFKVLTVYLCRKSVTNAHFTKNFIILLSKYLLKRSQSHNIFLQKVEDNLYNEGSLTYCGGRLQSNLKERIQIHWVRLHVVIYLFRPWMHLWSNSKTSKYALYQNPPGLPHSSPFPKFQYIKHWGQRKEGVRKNKWKRLTQSDDNSMSISKGPHSWKLRPKV